MTPVEVPKLVEALKLDLVGPENGTDLEAEVLPQAPSRWYLTGFLVPLEAGEAQKSDETAQDEFDFDRRRWRRDRRRHHARAAGRPPGVLPLLDRPEPARLQGDPSAPGRGELGRLPGRAPGRPGGRRERVPHPRSAAGCRSAGGASPAASRLTLNLARRNRQGRRARGPGQRRTARGGLGPPGASPGDRRGDGPRRARAPSPSSWSITASRRSDELRDERFIFQAGLAVHSAEPLIPRPNLEGPRDRGVGRARRRPAIPRRLRVRRGPRHRDPCRDRRGGRPAAPSAPAGFPRPRSSASPPPRSRTSSCAWRPSPSWPTVPAAQKALGPFVKQYRDWIDGPEEGPAVPDPQAPRDGRSPLAAGRHGGRSASRTASRSWPTRTRCSPSAWPTA